MIYVVEGISANSTVGQKSLRRNVILQALQGALAAGREKEGERVTTSLEFEFHLQLPCGSPSTELSDFRQSAERGNECECKQTLNNTCQR